jgi:hypothetical protein
LTTRHVSSTPTSGGLTLHEYRHVLDTVKGPLPVRTFLTEGLAARGGTEVRATVPEGWTEGASAALRTLELQERFVAEGRPAALGGFTGFRVPGLAGGATVGLTYARGQRVDGIAGSEDALMAVLLHPDELALVQQGLAARVLGALGALTRYFPCPPWWELRSQPVLTPAQQSQSLLERVAPRVAAGDVRITQLEDGSLRLSLPESAVPTLAQLWAQAPQTRTLVLLAQLAPDADGQMVWVPGSTTPNAIAAGAGQPRRMGYAFLALVGHDEPDLRMIEDGVALLLPPEPFDALQAALSSGRSETVRAGSLTLRLEVRPAGREIFHPERPRPETELATLQVVLLIPAAELEGRVEVDALAAFVRQLDDTLQQLAASHPVAAEASVAVEVTLSPDAPPRLQVSSRPPELALLAPLRQSLPGLPPVPVRGEVPFRLEAKIRPPPS